jgi:hypothetical protein
MQTFSEIIGAFGGTGPFSRATGISESHVRAMKTRESIAPEHWAGIVAAAAEHAVDGVTYEKLAEIRTARCADKSLNSGRKPVRRRSSS